MRRRSILMASFGLLSAGLVSSWLGRAAQAHHGWSWAEDGNFELTGVITAARLGNPHGILEVDVEGVIWTVEVGQPWRNARAGLSDDMLVEGVEIMVSGARSADHSENRVKAERVTIDGVLYELYPERD
jgi:hypothetical protein